MTRKLTPLCHLAMLILAANFASALHGAEPAANQTAANQPVDPIEWTESQTPPTFREFYKGKDYKRRFEKAAKEIDIAALAKANEPLAGMRVTGVTAGTPAEQIGLKAGDIVTKLDGEQVWENWRRRDDQPQSMTFISKDGAVHNVRIEPGTIGFDSRFQWQPQFEYLRSPAHDPRWDKEALVGILLRDTNPYLAESALHHAIAAGLVPDQLVDGVGIEIAYAEGRNAAALDFVWSALVVHRTRGKTLFNPQMLYRVAIANYKLDVAAAVLRDYPGAMSSEADALSQLAEMHRARPPAERFRPAPSEEAENLRRMDLVPVLQPANDWTRKDFKKLLISHDSFRLNLPSSYFNFLAYKPKPPVRDMEAVLKLSIRPSDDKKTDYARILEIWFANEQSHRADVDDSDDVAHEPNPLYIAFESSDANTLQTVTMAHSGIAGTSISFEDPLVKLNGKQTIRLRLLRIGGEEEIFLNDRRLLFAPVDPKAADLRFAMKVVGMTVNVKEFHISQLVPKTTVHQAADGGILLKAIDANFHGNRIRYNGANDRKCIDNWTNRKDWVDWDVQVDKPGKFEVGVRRGCVKKYAGSKYVVSVGPEKAATASGMVKATRQMNDFQLEKLGTIEIAKAGHVSIAVRATSMPKSRVMTLEQVEFTPEK